MSQNITPMIIVLSVLSICKPYPPADSEIVHVHYRYG